MSNRHVVVDTTKLEVGMEFPSENALFVFLGFNPYTDIENKIACGSKKKFIKQKIDQYVKYEKVGERTYRIRITEILK